jgi:hypothetical protein
MELIVWNNAVWAFRAERRRPEKKVKTHCFSSLTRLQIWVGMREHLPSPDTRLARAPDHFL